MSNNDLIGTEGREWITSLMGHLTELKQRATRAIIFVLAGIMLIMFFVDPILAWLIKPLSDIDVDVIVTGPTEAPLMYFKVAMVLGIGAAMPFIVRELYGFVMPGLYPSERKIFGMSIPLVLIFFILGAAFTLQILIPLSMPVLVGWLSDIVTPTYKLESYISFVMTMVGWMGVIFQTPLVVYLIARLGVVSFDNLKSARRIVWFIAVVFAAVVTPTTDPLTLILVTGPFIALYEVGLLLARAAARQRAKQQAEREIDF